MKKKYIIISMLSLLIITIGASYAYFTGMIIGEGKQITLKAKKLAVIFTDTSIIAEESINPGWEVSKTFTVENKSGNVFYYDINIEDLINTFVTEGYLQYKITSNGGGYNMDSFIDIPKSSEARRENLAQKIKIEDNEKHTYTIEFKYPNDPNVNQSEDMGEVFSGTLSITESEILVVKYKVEGVIQEEIPSKEIPYIVNNVTCTNNAKGKWNEESETVELETPVRQTVCIVEFGDGYTVSMLTEYGEVVSPVSKVVGRIGTTTFDVEEKAGYSLSDAKVICDNGAEGSISNKIITINNIKQNNTCRVISNPIEITVTYDVNGGNIISPNSKTVTYTGTYGSLPTPTRTGYTFVGWYTSATSGSKIEESTEVTSTVSHTIYAKWTAKTVNVSYNVNGGNALNLNSKNVTFDGTYGNLPTPSRTGHIFLGWFTESGSQVSSNTKVTNENAHSIYAYWNINSYAVTVNVVNGYVTSTNPLSINYGGSGTFTIAANNGYKLDGATVSCSGGTYNQAGTLTVSNVTSARTCTITLAQSKVTFTMKSSSCYDRTYNNSSPCYIIYYGLGKYGNYSSESDRDWDGTATYEGKTYTNCVIDSYGVMNDLICEKYGQVDERYSDMLNPNKYYIWPSGKNSTYESCIWYIEAIQDAANWDASCKVTLTCNG